MPTSTPPKAVTEQALVFDCQGEALVGVVSLPAVPQDTGVVIVVGGPQYRVGAHRQFVHLARHLAAAGYPVLRFDVRGMGDSAGAQRSFEALSDDVAAAIDAFTARHPAVRRVVLWGLCDGASAALMHVQQKADARVCGLVLLNPWVRSADTLARTHLKHYYLQRLTQRDFWAKLLRGGVGVKAVGGLASNIREASGAGGGGKEAAKTFQDRMAAGWEAFRHPVLLVLSGNDYTAKEFGEYVAARPAWQKLLERSGCSRVDIADADHTFSGGEARRAAEAATLRWLAVLC